jgi:cell division protein FtsI (penicillin-binding protein 3)
MSAVLKNIRYGNRSRYQAGYRLHSKHKNRKQLQPFLLKREEASLNAHTIVPFTASKREFRVRTIFLFSLFWACALLSTLYSIQILDKGKWREYASKNFRKEFKLFSERGSILDRNGKILALSVPASSLYFRKKDLQKALRENPTEVISPLQAVSFIAETLDMSESEIHEKLTSERDFVWLKRQIPRDIAEKITTRKLGGIGIEHEFKRIYPFTSAASRIIGTVGSPESGKSAGSGTLGLELRFNKYLSVDDVSLPVAKDAFGKLIYEGSKSDAFLIPKGKSLSLTLDIGIQAILDEEVEYAKQNAQAKEVLGAVIDSDTGQILAMSQTSPHNFNVDKVTEKCLFDNKPLQLAFEPGSVMKPLIASYALEKGLVNEKELFINEKNLLAFAGRRFHDTHFSKVLTFSDVIARSSNLGMIKIAMRMGKQTIYDALQKYGFGSSTGTTLPGEAIGQFRKPEQWAEVDIATHSFGYGISVTPLQLVRAFAAIVNDGVLLPLQIVKNGNQPEESSRVISTRTAQRMRKMLINVVEDKEGTGRNAAIEGIIVGGKTGTAKKIDPLTKRYSNAYYASFIGFADASSLGIKENLVTYILVDEPSNGEIYGSQVAAPYFKRAVQRIVNYLHTHKHLKD